MMSRNAQHAVRFLGVSACAAGLWASGCSKPPPPPPPPPPPRETPPPPPPPVSFEALGQEMRTDRRVTAAPGLDVTDESFARAAMQLADALARGDHAKSSSLMTRRAAALVSELVSSGAWDEQTKNIEAVRIVYAAPPVGSGDLDRAAAVDALVRESEKQLAAKKAQYERDMMPAEEMQRRLAMETEAMMRLAEVLRLETDASKIEDRPSMVLLLAVQDPQGSYLLGWGGQNAGTGQWLFNNVSTIALARKRAQDWDGIGMLGFSVGASEAAGTLPDVPVPAPAPGGPQGPRGG